ncbi:MAG: DUF2779 domain-containing protein [Verrucomicrobia bacterium]|nr:DUF2779 domain-containing protein [Verrucomicrobiota bacterium]
MRLLSKSRLIAFRQCPKRLWLEVHRPDLREDSIATLASFHVGHQVGDIARRIYDPKGKGTVIDVKAEGYDGAIARTEKLLAHSRQPIFEAGFRAAGGLAFADVMLPEDDAGGRAWRMVEVKSSTSVKDYHRDDVAVQAFIARAAGVKLKSVAVACIDSSWVYPGGEDYRGLLKETELSEETFARNDEVKDWMAGAQNVVSQPTEPAIGVGPHCHIPFDCGFCVHCNRATPPTEHPIDWLPHLSTTQRRRLAELGVNDLRAVPDELLNGKQRLVKKHTLNKTVFFDAAGAAADLVVHDFPAYFLDFETIQFAVPIWKGTRPYQQIPFQFSLHALSKSGQLSESAFLDLSGHDPSESLARTLIAACGVSGPIFVYNAGFETARIDELANRYPDLARPLLALNARVVDLLPIVRRRYYHPIQRGSWSIKAVLPAAVPELTYDVLAGVKDGEAAMAAFCEAIQPGTAEERKSEIERQLLAYCRLDTFALVRLWQFFNRRHEPAPEGERARNATPRNR